MKDIKCSKCGRVIGRYEGEDFVLTWYGEASKNAWIICIQCYKETRPELHWITGTDTERVKWITGTDIVKWTST